MKTIFYLSEKGSSRIVGALDSFGRGLGSKLGQDFFIFDLSEDISS